jgi:hypothetical protein
MGARRLKDVAEMVAGRTGCKVCFLPARQCEVQHFVADVGVMDGYFDLSPQIGLDDFIAQEMGR